MKDENSKVEDILSSKDMISLPKKGADTQNIGNQSAAKPSIFTRTTAVFFNLLKKLGGVAVFIGLSVGFSKLATVHGKDIPTDYFVNGYPSIIGLMNSEFFMGLIFMVTLSIIIYVLYLLWELHEVAVHKTQQVASQHVQVVFALSLCGLFIDKVWWVLAIIIAFTRWDLISLKLSEIISNGVNAKVEVNEPKQGDK